MRRIISLLLHLVAVIDTGLRSKVLMSIKSYSSRMNSIVLKQKGRKSMKGGLILKLVRFLFIEKKNSGNAH